MSTSPASYQSIAIRYFELGIRIIDTRLEERLYLASLLLSKIIVIMTALVDNAYVKEPGGVFYAWCFPGEDRIGKFDSTSWRETDSM